MQAALRIIEHALFRFPGPHERLAKVGVLENQKQFRWKLLVGQEQVFLRCAAHSRQDLEDEVLYIDSALVGGWTLPMPPIENFRRYHAQELRLQATLCSNARPVLWRLCVSLSHTERYVRGLLLLLPRLAQKQQVSGKKMPERLQASAPRVPRRRNCTHPVGTACSWGANPSLSVRCSNRHQVLLQRYLAERPRPRCHRRRHRNPSPRHDSHLAGAAELDILSTPLPQMARTLARKVGRA